MTEKWRWFLVCAFAILGIAVLVITFNTPKIFDRRLFMRIGMQIGATLLIVSVYFIYRIFTDPDSN